VQRGARIAAAKEARVRAAEGVAHRTNPASCRPARMIQADCAAMEIAGVSVCATQPHSQKEKKKEKKCGMNKLCSLFFFFSDGHVDLRFGIFDSGVTYQLDNSQVSIDNFAFASQEVPNPDGNHEREHGQRQDGEDRLLKE